jgi:hypothetical protein
LAHSEDRQVLGAEFGVMLLHAVCNQRRLHQVAWVENDQLGVRWRRNEA